MKISTEVRGKHAKAVSDLRRKYESSEDELRGAHRDAEEGLHREGGGQRS